MASSTSLKSSQVATRRGGRQKGAPNKGQAVRERTFFSQCLEPRHDVIPASQKGEVNLVSQKGEVNLASQATGPDSQHQDVIFASR
jgi:hypothetical protein